MPTAPGTTKTPYQRWIEGEGVPIIEGAGVEDVGQIALGPWPRMGGSGAFVQLWGMEGVTGMYVAQIPSGGALNPEKHVYEEVIYVLQGRGLTEVWQEGQAKQVFEWGEGSLFALPLNSWHRLANGTREPALLMAVTNAPMVMDLFHNPGFIFNSDYLFTDRYEGREDYFACEGLRFQAGLGNYWETNFIPDVRTAVLDDFERKVSGGQLTCFEMADNVLVGHITDWPAGRYHKGHYHGAGAILLCLRSKGYTLLWPKEVGPRPYQSGREDTVVKLDWRPGGVVSPPDGWFHQHFNAGAEPTRMLAIRYGSRLNPVAFTIAAYRRDDGVLMSIREGGTLIEYEDEDPEIRRRWEEAISQEGVKSQMPPVTYR